MMVHRTLHDVNKRRQNVVVSGLDETDNDHQVFISLCEKYLSIKPLVAERDCIRIGSKRSDRPRLLLVRLRSEQSASAVLKAARRLRHCDDPAISGHVFINQDLSPEAAKLAYERRRQRRMRVTSDGEPVNVATTASTVNDGRRQQQQQQQSSQPELNIANQSAPAAVAVSLDTRDEPSVGRPN